MSDVLEVMGERPLANEWEAQADAWARWTRTPGHDHHFSRYNWPSFLQLIPSVEGRTLDVGCGEGRVGVALHQSGHRLVGVDSAPSLARLATQTGAYERVVVADAAAMPFTDGVFDVVVAFMSLQDMDDAGGAVREAARVLSPGGRFVAAVVHPFASAHLRRDAVEQRSYFETQRTLDAVDRDGLSFAFHQMHRSLESWLGLFFDAGLRIEDLREPRPTEADVVAEPRLAKSRNYPPFLHVRCAR
ncbi:MAG TPA: class I SAM-dependent methyltransferase [Solirubrobacteraceae bacterium]|nr:class I SAM-dependent methyltransferase [Solirubrobacteraceae bacterium]